MNVEWFTPQILGTELAAVREVLARGFINDGPMTAVFETEIASRAHRKYAVAVPSGTVAIAMALIAAGLKPGDRVLVPDFTFLATANAVRLAGGVPMFADVSRENFNVTAEYAQDTYATRDIRFAVPVEVNGREVEPDFYRSCRDYGMQVITDSCEALGSGWCGSRGIASCFSFSPNKLVTTGQGGAVVTDDLDFHVRLRQLKYQGFVGRSTGADENPPTLGFNFKFTDIQAAIGLEQFSALDDRREACKIRDQRYRNELAGIVEFPAVLNDGVHLWTDILTDEAKPLAAYLQRRGIATRKFWLPLHRLTPNKLEFDTQYPNADYVSANGLWLPSSYTITEDQVKEVCDAIKAYMG